MKHEITAYWMNVPKRTILHVWNWKDMWGEIHIVDEDGWRHVGIGRDVRVKMENGELVWVRPVNWIGAPFTKEIAQEAIDYVNETARLARRAKKQVDRAFARELVSRLNKI